VRPSQFASFNLKFMNLDLIIHVLYLFLFSLVLAFLETQIEGGAGWAKSLPTWRPASSKWYAKLYGKIMGGKELTGYHIMVFSLVFLFLHYPYFSGRLWSIFSELTTLSFFFIVTVVWDFLWFVINPKYDFLDFWAKRVWWHKKWFFHFPYEYWFALIISVILYVKNPFNFPLLKEWLLVFSLFFILTIITMLFADLGGILKKNDSRRKILH
jgi:hypothetical protein